MPAASDSAERPAPATLPVAGRCLRAGPLRMELHGTVLRYVRWGDRELVRRVYPAVRDPGWGTVPARTSDLRVVEHADSFEVTFRARHEHGALRFGWDGAITGSASGVVTYSMTGQAERDFSYNRIGLCVAHPVSQAGSRLTTYRQGQAGEAELPVLVAPQRWVDGTAHPALGPFDRLDVHLPGIGDLRLVLAGDEFELEDQRNWADGSYKTYSTPLALGWPHDARTGQRFAQSVEISLQPEAGAAPAAAGSPGADLAVRLRHTGVRMPTIGTHLRGAAPPGRQAEGALQALGLDHVRVDLDPRDAGSVERVEAAGSLARRLGLGLELAVHLDGDADVERAALACAAVLDGVPLVRVLLLRDDFDLVAAAQAARVRAVLPPSDVLLGTAGNFAEINRSSLEPAAADGLAFPLTPSFHDLDGLSILEGIEAVVPVVRTASRKSGGGPVCVSPLTLRPQRNLFAPEWSDDDATDERLGTSFAAGWLVGVLAELAVAGAESVTAFELEGPRGLVEASGAVRPLCAVLAEVSRARTRRSVACDVGDPLRLAALAFDSEAETRVLLANLRAELQGVRLHPLRPSGTAVARRLSAASSYEHGLVSAPPEDIDPERVLLGPFEVVLITLKGP